MRSFAASVGVVFRRGCVREGAGEGGVYSTSNLFLVYVLCTMICKAFHAFLELSKLEGETEGSTGLRQITVYWKECCYAGEDACVQTHLGK